MTYFTLDKSLRNANRISVFCRQAKLKSWMILQCVNNLICDSYALTEPFSFLTARVENGHDPGQTILFNSLLVDSTRKFKQDGPCCIIVTCIDRIAHFLVYLTFKFTATFINAFVEVKLLPVVFVFYSTYL